MKISVSSKKAANTLYNLFSWFSLIRRVKPLKDQGRDYICRFLNRSSSFLLSTLMYKTNQLFSAMLFIFEKQLLNSQLDYKGVLSHGDES